MKRIILGQSGLDVPVFAVGTAPMARIPIEQGMQVLQRAYELGATWWDTSDDYGTHGLLARVLPKYPRAELTISTKSSAHSREEGEASIRQVCFQLGTDSVDLLFLHYVKDSEDFTQRRGFLDAMREAKARGTIRAIGLSSHLPDPINLAADHPDIDVVMVPWNVRGVMPSGGSFVQMVNAIQHCYAAGKGVILMKILDAGRLYDICDEAIAGAAHVAFKHALNIGVQSIHELEADIRLTLGQPVDAGILQHLKAGSSWGKAA
ncbi:MAG: aldo/keto reductase [Armatimonadota bacterium]